MRYTTGLLMIALLLIPACKPQAPEVTAPPVVPPAPQVKQTPSFETSPRAALRGPTRFSATAYAIEGITAAGTRARRGIVAADPKVLPLRSKIRVSGAGAYSGEYLVEDTGPAVKGRIIDIKVGSRKEAIQFGRKNVQVEVLRWGAEDAEAKANSPRRADPGASLSRFFTQR